MKNNNIFELYTDYLLTSFSYTTARRLSDILDGNVSHDQVTRFLSNKDYYTSEDRWKSLKKMYEKFADKKRQYSRNFDTYAVTLCQELPLKTHKKLVATFVEIIF